MNIIINQHRLLSDIQQDFQTMFPFLKIEFYTRNGAGSDGQAQMKILDHHLHISEVHSNGAEGEINITPDMKVKDLEEAFEQKFGLHAQLFRKSGHVWLLTIRTDHWTLAEQHQEAINMSTHEKSEEPGDYHEQE